MSSVCRGVHYQGVGRNEDGFCRVEQSGCWAVQSKGGQQLRSRQITPNRHAKSDHFCALTRSSSTSNSSGSRLWFASWRLVANVGGCGWSTLLV